MYHPTDVHIGRKMREKRVALGMSQAALAEQLGITFQQVQKYESGANRIGGSRLWDISRVLREQIGYFYEGLGEGKNASKSAEDTLPLSKQTLELARAINSIPEGSVKDEVMQLVKAFARIS